MYWSMYNSTVSVLVLPHLDAASEELPNRGHYVIRYRGLAMITSRTCLAKALSVEEGTFQPCLSSSAKKLR